MRAEPLALEPGDAGPWARLDCEDCDEVRRRQRGCLVASTIPGAPPHRSLTAPSMPLRSRCPRAIINPETDEFDPEIAELISVASDMERTHLPYVAGGLRDQPAKLIEAGRLVSTTVQRMTSIRMEHAQAKARKGRG